MVILRRKKTSFGIFRKTLILWYFQKTLFSKTQKHKWLISSPIHKRKSGISTCSEEASTSLPRGDLCLLLLMSTLLLFFFFFLLAEFCWFSCMDKISFSISNFFSNCNLQLFAFDNLWFWVWITQLLHCVSKRQESLKQLHDSFSKL